MNKNAVLSLCSDPAIKEEQNRNVRNHRKPSSNSNAKKWNRKTGFKRLIPQPFNFDETLNLTDSFTSMFWCANVQSVLSRLYSQEAPPQEAIYTGCQAL